MNGPFCSRFIERFNSLERDGLGLIQIAGFDLYKRFPDQGAGCAFINAVSGPAFFILPFSFL